MIDQTKFSIRGVDRPYQITITPVILPMSGVKYATGQYKLKEGPIGLGSITFNDDMRWQFEGADDFDADQIERLANFIKITYGHGEPVETKKVELTEQINIAQNKVRNWFGFGAIFG